MFSALHAHLAINHSPLYAELLAFFFFLIGFIRRNRTLATAGLVITIIAAVCASAAYYTGDQSKDVIEHSAPIAGVDKMSIGPHDDAAGYFLASSCITAALAILALWIGRRRERPRWLDIVILVAIFFSLTVVARVAVLGGRIHHPEVREVVGPG